MTKQIKITYSSIDQAAADLVKLFYKLDKHQMYTDILTDSSGKTRDEVGHLTDELNKTKATIGKLIDGTRAILCEMSQEFAQADKIAARYCEISKPNNLIAEGRAGTKGSVFGFSYSSSADSNGNASTSVNVERGQNYRYSEQASGESSSDGLKYSKDITEKVSVDSHNNALNKDYRKSPDSEKPKAKVKFK